MNIASITLYGFISGIVGTAAGGFIALFLPQDNKRLISFLLEFSAGLMLSVSCFDLLPSAFSYAGLTTVLLGVVLGAVSMIAAQSLTDCVIKDNGIRATGIAIAIGVSLHNLPEGLAVGSGFEASISLGLTLALTIMLHDIPEGMSIVVPLRAGGLNKKKAFIYTALSGLPMAVGAYFGAKAGQVSASLISCCLALAAGAMLYVVLAEMIPESKRLYFGRLGSIGCIVGFIIGIIVTKVL